MAIAERFPLLCPRSGIRPSRKTGMQWLSGEFLGSVSEQKGGENRVKSQKHPKELTNCGLQGVCWIQSFDRKGLCFWVLGCHPDIEKKQRLRVGSQDKMGVFSGVLVDGRSRATFTIRRSLK